MAITNSAKVKGNGSDAVELSRRILIYGAFGGGTGALKSPPSVPRTELSASGRGAKSIPVNTIPITH